MPIKRIWTETEDTIIREMEAAGQSTQDIAMVIGVSRTTIRWRGHELGIDRWRGHDTSAPRRPAETELQSSMYDHRSPLPAGHPISWGSIVAGTCLDGEEYPA